MTYPDEPGATPPVPHDMAAERALLGAVLLSSGDALADMLDIVGSQDFFLPGHQVIFDAAVEMFSIGEPVDPVTMHTRLQRDGTLARVGGGVYLHTLTESVPTVASASWYARTVNQLAVLRRLVQAGTRVTQRAQSAAGQFAPGTASHDIDQVGEAALNDVFGALGADTYGGAPMLDVANAGPATLVAIGQAHSQPGGLQGLPTGFSEIDGLTGGLRPGQLIIVAGRPGLGKSTLALDISRHVAFRHDTPVAFFSLEMSSDDLMFRLSSAESGVALAKVMSGQCNDREWDTLTTTLAGFPTDKLFFCSQPAVGVSTVRAKSRQLMRRHGLGLIVVDYLQLMRPPTTRAENRQLEVQAISGALKALAMELGVVVLAVSQLNRALEARASKRPQLGDLRESGSLEQDADVVMFVHRDDAWDKDSPRAGEADVLVEKNRSGPTGISTLVFQGHNARFTDMWREPVTSM